MSGKRVKDYSLYTGALGTAYLLFKAYQVTRNQNDLNLCSDIIKACDSVSRDSGYSLSLSFSLSVWLLAHPRIGVTTFGYFNAEVALIVWELRF
jgi:hypothetical protein